jgi:hypothetical protein
MVASLNIAVFFENLHLFKGFPGGFQPSARKCPA